MKPNRYSAIVESLGLLLLLLGMWADTTLAQTPLESPVSKLNYEAVAGFFRLPPGENFVEPCGVAVNSKGHIYVFHRGKHPLMEFDPSGKFLRSIADDLFVTAHMVRMDAEDNIWTTDVGSHVVLKLSPEGRVLLALGRMRLPGDDVLHFNQPTDVAVDRDGNIYVTDGYGNSRVLKFDKFGNPLLGWGMKGSGSGQFDLPHTIVIDGDRVYVGDRENARIQIFDTSGRFLQEWRLGHPFGLFVTPDHFIYMGDAIAARILENRPRRKSGGSLPGTRARPRPPFRSACGCCGQRRFGLHGRGRGLAGSEVSFEVRFPSSNQPFERLRSASQRLRSASHAPAAEPQAVRRR